jgi:Fe-Mn family superoxide dismutase
MAVQLPDLPYAKEALEPHISARTLEFHHGKHHNTYVNNLNGLIQGTEFDSMALEDIIKKVYNNPDKVGVFNNGAQAWNHAFYWQCMEPKGGGEPGGALIEKIKEDFGSFDQFKEEFITAGKTQFGSGWAWLVQDGSKLKVMKTLNADTPLAQGLTPLMTADVWEHAYYLDYQNRKPDYLTTFMENLVNWDFVASNMK